MIRTFVHTARDAAPDSTAAGHKYDKQAPVLNFPDELEK
jgi:hypothetical protein